MKKEIITLLSLLMAISSCSTKQESTKEAEKSLRSQSASERLNNLEHNNKIILQDLD